MTGCDMSSIMDTVTKVADGIQQAVPAIQEVVQNVGNAVNTIGNAVNNTTTATNTENNAANTNGQVAITNAGDQENLGNNTTNNNTTSGATALGRRINSAALDLVSRYSTRLSFPYDPLTQNGNLGCAQVVTTALKAAGAVTSINLNCDGVVADLRSKGWRSVTVPPVQEGDVITWRTSRGPGRHIGIIVKSGNNYMAMNNSSSEQRPKLTAYNYLPITQVLRKA
jgi:hypothetical protein